MMRITLTLILFCVAVPLFAQDLYLRNDTYMSELYLKMNPKEVAKVDKLDSAVRFTFRRNLSKGFNNPIGEGYFTQVTGSGNTITVSVKPGMNFSVITDSHGVKVVATQPKKQQDLLMGYGIEKPFIRNRAGIEENVAVDRFLATIDTYIAQGKGLKAINELNKFIPTAPNDYYRQEAHFRLGLAYMKNGEVNKAYYINAAKIFDDFVSKYPENYRLPNAKMNAAKSKDLAGLSFEAILTYRNIFTTTTETDIRRTALRRIAELYQEIGQMDKATETYEEYLKNFRHDFVPITAQIGSMYYRRGDVDMAYEHFLRIPPDRRFTSGLSEDALYSMGIVFREKGDHRTSGTIFRHLFNQYPNSPYADMAMYNAALISGQLGDSSAEDELLLKAREAYAEKKGGGLATVRYAEKYLDKKGSDHWQAFLNPVFTGRTDVNTLAKAWMLIINAQKNEGKDREALASIRNFEQRFATSGEADKVSAIKQEVMVSLGRKQYMAKDFAGAESTLNTLLKNYPDTKYLADVKKILDDIRFGRVRALFDKQKYRDTIIEIEKLIATGKDIYDMPRWIALLEDAYLRYAQQFRTAGNMPAVVTIARQYLSNLPTGKHAQEFRGMYQVAFLGQINQLAAGGRHLDMAKLYDANASWIDRWPDKKFADKIRQETSMALYKMSLIPQARELFTKITPNTEMTYRVLEILLSGKPLSFDVNLLDPNTFGYVVTELEKRDVDTALKVLGQYKKDPKYATKQRYRLAKGLKDDAKREAILKELYNTLVAYQNAAFDGSDEVFMDIGIMHYRRGQYTEAVLPLKNFLERHKKLDERRAEGLYHLGKSLSAIGDARNARIFYQEIIDKIPESIYASIARSEMESETWKKSLNRL